MGGATGEAFSNVLLGTELTPEEVLAREVIQNSADAHAADDQKLAVSFRRVTLRGRERTDFFRSLDLTSIADRSAVLELGHENCLTGNQLDLLYVEDFGTKGLTGDPHQKDSPFYKLLLTLGDSSKARELDTSGGSYGYGKSVLSGSSNIHTIVVFSTYRDQGNVGAKLMACGYFNGHEFEGGEFTGRAWLGTSGAEADGRVYPLANLEAMDLASRLGFKIRDENTLGTSILIVDCDLDLDALRSSIEDWWWPRLVDNSIDIEIWNESTRLEPPRPKSKQHLKPFIHCYDMATGVGSKRGDQDRVGKLSKFRQRELGTYGFTMIDEVEGDERNGGKFSDCIALVRGSRMIVAYEQVSGLSHPCVGVFTASPEIDHILKLSEPPAHDRWAETCTRLEESIEKPLVKAVKDRLRANIRQFSREAIPPPLPQERRLDFLEQLLGEALNAPFDQGAPGGTNSDPIVIEYIDGPRAEFTQDKVRTVGEFRLRLSPLADRSQVPLEVKVQCVPIEEGGREDKEHEIPSSILASEGNCTFGDPTSDGWYPVTLGPDSTARFLYTSDLYSNDWASKVIVDVREKV
jgi:hypothetical protein